MIRISLFSVDRSSQRVMFHGGNMSYDCQSISSCIFWRHVLKLALHLEYCVIFMTTIKLNTSFKASEHLLIQQVLIYFIMSTKGSSYFSITKEPILLPDKNRERQ